MCVKGMCVCVLLCQSVWRRMKGKGDNVGRVTCVLWRCYQGGVDREENSGAVFRFCFRLLVSVRVLICFLWGYFV